MTCLVGLYFGGTYFRNFKVPYYRELKLHEIQVLEINAT